MASSGDVTQFIMAQLNIIEVMPFDGRCMPVDRRQAALSEGHQSLRDNNYVHLTNVNMEIKRLAGSLAWLVYTLNCLLYLVLLDDNCDAYLQYFHSS